MSANKAGRSLMGIAVAVLALAAAPALAQTAGPSAEAEPGGHAAPRDPETPGGAGGEHAGEASPAGHGDPTQHFNFFGRKPGQLFDYIGKDEYGGPMGDGKMEDPRTGHVVREEEPASPPFVFAVLNFVLLLALLAWKGRPAVQKMAAERHDLIKTALDEAADLRKQAAAKLAEYETRLQAADAQIKELVDGMRADARAEEQRILAAAEAQAAMMKRDAELRIAAEIELARAQLTREVTAASVAATEKLLRERMTAGDQQQLVAAFITDVQQGGAGRTGRGEVR